ncbi:MAG: bifunctional transaldolase/phosoglucose isomerase [Firmicutes bacterium]|nr:bifunctional transaldolase/phosoglucose isomerase [Alicyclobacillaceae bacterium]MCL6496559.1 bifunctional transaldolase/phosoglucose isomerase [Bacillota bacterium]
MNAIGRLNQLGQSIWYDYIRRSLITSGAWDQLVQAGVSGITSNPTIFERAIDASDDYDAALTGLVEEGADLAAIYDALVFEDIARAADRLRPRWEATQGQDGYASIEVSPELADDTAGTVREAHRIFARIGRPNVMIKVPATEAGLPAIRQLIADGIPVNVTLIFGLTMYDRVIDAYLSGLEQRRGRRQPLETVASVASFFVSRVDTLVDRRLSELGLDPGWAGRAAIANAKLAYQRFRERFAGARFEALRAAGARVQRPLWASTSTKNPAYPPLMYVTELVAPDTVNTLPPATLDALLAYQGPLRETATQGVEEARDHVARLARAGIDLEQVADELLAEGVASFASAFQTLRRELAHKRARTVAQCFPPRLSPPDHLPGLEDAEAEAETLRLSARLEARDVTLWPGDRRQLSQSLGWLGLPEWLENQLPDLTAFATEVAAAGFRDAVVLGMGGSSLIADVWAHSLAPGRGGLGLHVLDSTHPRAVSRLATSLSLPHTLFLVASKSGDTTETLLFYRYFWDLLEREQGHPAPEQFVAITDPGSPLAREAEARRFRRIFLNPPDVGGRYSALSYFGMVPAALYGIDLRALLRRTQALPRPVSGVWLGTVLGQAARLGRNKITLWLPQPLAWFGDWLEQLLAESTGKDGRGLVPVAHEPAQDRYGPDRLVVRYRLAGHPEPDRDRIQAAMQAQGQPVVELTVADGYDLAAECLRWELATAVAGHWLTVNPFDQPNVQESKDRTKAALAEYESHGELVLPDPDLVVGALAIRWHHLPGPVPQAVAEVWRAALTDLSPNAYVALMAFLDPSAENWHALERLREALAHRSGRAVTLGFGPRFLHSTGQLHKGGPAEGVFIQLVDDAPPVLKIPGSAWDFGTVLRAQAYGDFQALAAHGRRTVAFYLHGNPADQVQALAEGLRRR